MKHDLKYDYSLIESVEELNKYGLITEEQKAEKEAEKKLNKAKEKGDDKITNIVNDDPDDEQKLEKKKENKEVVYSDLKAKPTNIFKKILIFTNSRDPEQNKTLKNVMEAVKALKKAKCEIIPELYVFVAEEMTYTEDDNNILTISDGKETLEFDGESNLDTLVFSRLGVQGEDNCEHVVELLQDRGFLVLNPVRFAELASNKYETAVLFEKGEIPQPNFCLMNKDILYDEDLFKESMQKIYPKWDMKDPDKNEDFKLVCKILDGHGGTGVALIDGKKLTAWLQMVFAIDPERQLIIQKKEEGDGGDIRVHVLTLRNKQVILGAMKRVKLGGDFRSNVSLGAKAEPVKLTKEQEEIALKTAKLSQMPWCAVDIMPLVKGSNPELGDNVVLEINASPGTDGISKVLGTNFINIMLNELNDTTEFMLQDKVAGFMEGIEVDFGQGPIKMLAKLDTGNGASASHLEVGKIEDDGKYVSFTLDGKTYKLEKIGYSHAITGNEKHKRPIIALSEITLGQRKQKNIPIALVEARNKTSNALLNRELLSYFGYVVHPSKTHVLTEEMEKLKII